MPSSYSNTLGIELMVTGEKSGTWEILQIQI